MQSFRSSATCEALPKFSAWRCRLASCGPSSVLRAISGLCCRDIGQGVVWCCCVVWAFVSPPSSGLSVAPAREIATLHVALPVGVIRGALHALGVECTVRCSSCACLDIWQPYGSSHELSLVSPSPHRESMSEAQCVLSRHLCESLSTIRSELPSPIASTFFAVEPSSRLVRIDHRAFLLAEVVADVSAATLPTCHFKVMPWKAEESKDGQASQPSCCICIVAFVLSFPWSSRCQFCSCRHAHKGLWG